jgi:hypothetical protein
MRNPLLPQSNDDSASMVIYLVLALAFLIALGFFIYAS